MIERSSISEVESDFNVQAQCFVKKILKFINFFNPEILYIVILNKALCIEYLLSNCFPVIQVHIYAVHISLSFHCI